MLERMYNSRTLTHYWWDCKMAKPLWKIVWQSLTKQNIVSLEDPAITLWYLPKQGENVCPTKPARESLQQLYS